MFGICGDNCTDCPRYRATQNGGKDALEAVKALWIRLGLRDHDFPAQDMACHGCKPENPCAYLELRECVSRKGLDNCGSCRSYPCELINSAFEKSNKLEYRAIKICTPEEMDLLRKAFFSKKEYFDRIHQEYQKRLDAGLEGANEM